MLYYSCFDELFTHFVFFCCCCRSILAVLSCAIAVLTSNELSNPNPSRSLPFSRSL